VPSGVIIVSAPPPPLTLLHLLIARPPPATGALPSSENAVVNPVFLPLPIDKELW
jgi:hypothetical protein